MSKKEKLIALLHGGPGAAGELRPVAEALVPDFLVLELIQSAHSVEGQVAELREQLQAQAKLPAILVGHSWGAWLGVLLAARHPELVRKLILIGAPAFEDRFNTNLMPTRLGRLPQDRRRELQELLRKLQSGEEDEVLLHKLGTLMHRADAYDYLPDQAEPVVLDVKIFRKVWPQAAAMRTSGELVDKVRQLTCPVVALHGRQDPHPLEGVEKPLSEKCPDFRMIVLEKCGHAPWLERQARTSFFHILKEELSS